MFRYLAGALALAVIFPFPSSVEAASVRTDDVIVTANRLPQSQENVLSDTTVITQEEIQRAGQSTLVELLQAQPGVEISSNGGAGKTSNVYLRGTNADHVVVLIDGLRINSATTGTTSFEKMSLGQIERIEILRGPASSLYGADAIGGVIQIFTKHSEGAPRFSAFAGYGTYNTRKAEASVTGSQEGFKYALSVDALKTDGFSAKRSSLGFDGDNDAYRSTSISTALSRQFNDRHEVGVQFFQSRGSSQYDCYSYSTSKKRATADGSICNIDETLQSFGLFSKNQFLPFWLSTLRIGKGVDDMDDIAGRDSKTGDSRYSKFRTEQLQYSWQNDFTLPVGTLTLAYDRLEQNINGTSTYKVRSRDNNGWLASYLADIDDHSFQASMRRDDNSQYGQHTTGGLGYGYRISQEWRIRGSYGTAFKAPTFNQLYSSLGKPDLAPETSKNLEIGLNYASENLKGAATVFDNDIKNLISFTGPPTGFNVVSTGRANIRGITLNGAWQLTDHWSLGGNFTLQSPKDDIKDKLLPRRAQRHGALDLAYQSGPFRGGAEIIGSSQRFNDTDNTFRLGGYTLVNLTASYSFNNDWQVEARANNVFDRRYELASTKSASSPTGPDYETPGANLFIGLRWQPK